MARLRGCGPPAGEADLSEHALDLTQALSDLLRILGGDVVERHGEKGLHLCVGKTGGREGEREGERCQGTRLAAAGEGDGWAQEEGERSGTSSAAVGVNSYEARMRNR